MTFTLGTKLVTINNTEYELSAVNNLTRVEINNRLHYIGDQIHNLRIKQNELLKMRNLLDTQHEDVDLYNEMFMELSNNPDTN
jgi:hypothetical protein